ncbi:MAG: hypothetical protein A2Z16_02645 [Chloroflexi bacterium RBG_16_54_18]|nr:MAG: hypothetical protein A2Z16_02645 [Chloroflexi bacterium RBG_16_54_18]
MSRGDALAVRVLPRSRKNEILGLQADGRLRIRLKAVPESGKANQALIEFLAAVVQVPPSSIHIISGATSQNKLVQFDGLDSQAVIFRIMGTTG